MNLRGIHTLLFEPQQNEELKSTRTEAEALKRVQEGLEELLDEDTLPKLPKDQAYTSKMFKKLGDPASTVSTDAEREPEIKNSSKPNS